MLTKPKSSLTHINVFRVAIPAPLGQLFDYLPPPETSPIPPRPGLRVEVPFGRQRKIGILVSVSDQTDLPLGQLKPVHCILDPAPLLSDQDLELLTWVSRYYHHPLGQVYATALPAALRRGDPAQYPTTPWWQLTESGQTEAHSGLRATAHRQRALVQRLSKHPDGCSPDHFADLDWDWRGPLKTLLSKNWVRPIDPPPEVLSATQPPEFQPNPDQQAVIDAVLGAAEGFAPTLLEGITGSGKTEVYLKLIEAALERGRQALVLLPEISLTPQLAARFQSRLEAPMALFHSGLGDSQRLKAWLRVQSGEARILLGTRSAVFTPMPELGLIVLDEEHDGSFKQQDGLRYSARDVAIMRAKLSHIPIVMGSATPSFESLHNARQGRFHHGLLPRRAGLARPPQMKLIDCRQQRLQHGLSPPLIEAMQHTLQSEEQVLLFLNQRGYAPTLMCHACGWVAQCRRCDSRMVIHQAQQRLKCHHCGVEQVLPERCDACGRNELFALGQGTQRVESGLSDLFDDIPVTRIDRDSTRRKGALEQSLDTIQQGGARILIGTQMLAKGHHFPNVTLVGILDVDAGLYSCDFRAPERMAQLIVQVSGRAGRAEKPGRVLLQTHHPEHPLLQTLLHHGYAAFAEQALQERELAELPPFAFQALFRAEATVESAAIDFLHQARAALDSYGPRDVELLGPLPAPMLKRAGRYRYQLLLQSRARKPLHRLLAAARPRLDELPASRRVRWSLDIDPLDLF